MLVIWDFIDPVPEKEDLPNQFKFCTLNLGATLGYLFGFALGLAPPIPQQLPRRAKQSPGRFV